MVFVDYLCQGFFMQLAILQPLLPPPPTPEFWILLVYTILLTKKGGTPIYILSSGDLGRYLFHIPYRNVLVNNCMSDVTEPFFS